MDNNYSWGLDYIAHGWGKKPDQKQREKEYNHWYYENKIKKQNGLVDFTDKEENVRTTENVQKQQEDFDKFLADNPNPVTNMLASVRQALRTPIGSATATAYANEQKKEEEQDEWIEVAPGQYTLKKKKKK